MMCFWYISVLKHTLPYAIAEYLYMPTFTVHPHTDCLNRSSNNWKILQLCNTFMAIPPKYNIFDPRQLCQERGGLRCQMWKVTAEHSHSVSQWFTAAHSYWEQSLQSLKANPHLSLTYLTWSLDRSAYWLSKLQTIADTLKETFRCFTSRTSSVWRCRTPRQYDSTAPELFKKCCTILSFTVNSGTWLFYSIVFSTGVFRFFRFFIVAA